MYYFFWVKKKKWTTFQINNLSDYNSSQKQVVCRSKIHLSGTEESTFIAFSKATSLHADGAWTLPFHLQNTSVSFGNSGSESSTKVSEYKPHRGSDTKVITHTKNNQAKILETKFFSYGEDNVHMLIS